MGSNSSEDGVSRTFPTELPGLWLWGCAQVFQGRLGRQRVSQTLRSRPLSVQMTSFFLVLLDGLWLHFPRKTFSLN